MGCGSTFFMTAADDTPPAKPPFRWPLSLTPKLVSAFQEGYRLEDLKADALAGLTVAVVALPLAMGIAIASNATPAQGLWTAVVAGLLISALGGSRHQIGGPTAAFAVVVFDVIARFGMDGLALATLMAGAMLIAAGLLRAGVWMKYVPEPVVLGFTVGIALTIISTQFGALLGLEPSHAEGEPIPRWISYFEAWDTADLATAAVGVGAVLAILALRRWAPKAPGFLIAVTVASAAVALLKLSTDTIGSVYGATAATPPTLALPAISLARLQELLPSAFTIAFLAAVESLLSATVADGMTGRRHRSNCELVAQGVANAASGLIGGLPATGAIARTATNIRAGARTPISGILHAGFLLAFILAGGPLIALAPLAALAAILMVVAANMAEPRRVIRLLANAPWPDRWVFAITCALTVLVDLTVAVQVGVVLAAFLVMRQMAATVQITTGFDMTEEEGGEAPGVADLRSRLPEGVETFTLRGPLFYAAVDRFRITLDRVAHTPKAVILRMRDVTFVDATAAFAIVEMTHALERKGAVVILAAAQRPVLRTLIAMGLRDGGKVLAEGSTDEAIARARLLLEEAPTG